MLLQRTTLTNLFGAKSQPDLQFILNDTNAIEDQEAAAAGLFGGCALVWSNAEAPTNCIVAHVHCSIRI